MLITKYLIKYYLGDIRLVGAYRYTATFVNSFIEYSCCLGDIRLVGAYRYTASRLVNERNVFHAVWESRNMRQDESKIKN